MVALESEFYFPVASNFKINPSYGYSCEYVIVMVMLSDLVLSACEVAVIITVPAVIVVTKPLLSTVATDVLELDHVTALFVALEGNIEAVS